MYKAVIFDFDYTLGDSTNGIVLSINHALEKTWISSAGHEDHPKDNWALVERYIV